MDNLRDLGLLKCRRCLKAKPHLLALTGHYSTIDSLLSAGLALGMITEAVAAPTVAAGVAAAAAVEVVVGLVEAKAAKDTK